MAKLAENTGAGRRFGLIVGGVSAALIIGGGLVLLLFFIALGFANWVRSQPEPAVILLGDSMPPTLGSFDVVYLRPPTSLRRGDIISYSLGDSAISHRIVGLPAETIAVRQGQVRIGAGNTAQPLDEPYVRSVFTGWDAGPVLLGPDEYFTLGDNRAVPSGRTVHVVHRQNIRGVVYKIIFPPWRARILDLTQDAEKAPQHPVP